MNAGRRPIKKPSIVGSESGKVTRISISDCDESSKVCLFKRFTNATIELDFELGTMFIACHSELFFLFLMNRFIQLKQLRTLL